ncbi:MAG TPA: hypothetical protein VHC63_01505 [Acidimicrobiales bacterium]|nr:hypothetical protein [Acidimicrobiales bacterium]
MKLEFPGNDSPLDESWLEPLYEVRAVVEFDPAYQFFDPYDFMVMAKVVRSGRPNITQFKHRYTRRYLHLDLVGRAYRYIPPRDITRGSGRFVSAPSLEWALERLQLWELPWFKEELQQYQFGLRFDEAWRLSPQFDPRRFLADDYGLRDDDEDDWPCDGETVDQGGPDRRLRLVRGDTS